MATSEFEIVEVHHEAPAYNPEHRKANLPTRIISLTNFFLKLIVYVQLDDVSFDVNRKTICLFQVYGCRCPTQDVAPFVTVPILQGIVSFSANFENIIFIARTAKY